MGRAASAPGALTPPRPVTELLDHLVQVTSSPVDEALLQRALTHRSYAYEAGGLPHNERLEFLGDSVLGLVVTTTLHDAHPDTSEGQLAKLRASVVNMRALAEVGRTLGLGDYVFLGRGEETTGGRDKDSILADTVEAVIGAVYQSGGITAATELVHHLVDPLLAQAVTLGAGLDWKTSLQEISSGALLGPDQPVELRLLEITPALKALEGVVMELDDCAFPLLAGVQIGDDARTIFDGVNAAMLVGARPRTAGMERGDLLSANGAIFTAQGKALNDVAAADVHVLVTGNPANTNALIAMSNAPDIPKERFNALTRLDHNRAISQLAAKTGVPVTSIKQMTIWGNHSATQYPDLFHAEVDGKNAAELVGDQAWLENEFIPTVAKRGAAIIAARGSSSAASAANATVEHMRDWLLGSASGDWVSMAVPSDGSYGVPEGLISSFPCVTKDGGYEIVQGLDINDFSRAKIDASVAELTDEKNAVRDLGLI